MILHGSNGHKSFCRIIPQALCVRFSLAVGGNLFWLPWALIVLEFPIAWPIAKLLDFLLGTHTIEYEYKMHSCRYYVSSRSDLDLVGTINTLS